MEVDSRLQATGSALIENFGSRHEGLVEQIDHIGARLTQSIDEASERFASGVAEVDGRLQAAGSALIENFSTRHEGLVEQIDHVGSRLDAVARRHASERFATGVAEVDNRLQATGSALIENFDSRHGGLVEQIDQIGARLTQSLDEATREVGERFATGIADVDSRLQTTGSALIEDLGARHGGLVEQIDQIGARIAQSVDDATARSGNVSRPASPTSTTASGDGLGVDRGFRRASRRSRRADRSGRRAS